MRDRAPVTVASAAVLACLLFSESGSRGVRGLRGGCGGQPPALQMDRFKHEHCAAAAPTCRRL